MIQPRAHFSALHKTTYVEQAPPAPGLLDCALGVNPYGCAPQVAAAGLAGADLSPYPEPDGLSLRRRIAAAWFQHVPIGEEHILLQAGSMGVLQLANKLMLDPGDVVVGPAPLFVDYRMDLETMGGVYRPVPLRPEAGYAFDADAYVAALDGGGKIAYLDNPNNPTGQVLMYADVEKVVAAAARRGMLALVDEAYGDYMSDGNSAVTLVRKYDNLLVARSFSKGFGLAGLRVGYGVAQPALIRQLRAADTLFVTSTPALQLAAAALDHPGFIAQSRVGVSISNRRVRAALRVLRIAQARVEVPIILLYTDKPVDLQALFAKHGVWVSSGRHIDTLTERHVRLRVPRREQTDTLLEAIAKVEAELE